MNSWYSWLGKKKEQSSPKMLHMGLLATWSNPYRQLWTHKNLKYCLNGRKKKKGSYLVQISSFRFHFKRKHLHQLEAGTPQYSTPLKSENGDVPDASVSGLLPLEEWGCIHLWWMLLVDSAAKGAKWTPMHIRICEFIWYLQFFKWVVANVAIYCPHRGHDCNSMGVRWQH